MQSCLLLPGDIMSDMTPFIPDDFEVPTLLETPRFRLRPLTTADVDNERLAEPRVHARGEPERPCRAPAGVRAA
jgi:hypothetical protein